MSPVLRTVPRTVGTQRGLVERTDEWMSEGLVRKAVEQTGPGVFLGTEKREGNDVAEIRWQEHQV